MYQPLEVASWRMAVGDLPSERLTEIASAARADGVDSPSLRELAGLAAGDVRQAGDLFRDAVQELGLPVLTEDEAWWSLVRLTAAEIVSGAVSPERGARWIWSRAFSRVQEAGDLRVFVGLAAEWDDHPQARGEIDGQIILASTELLSRPSPRRWIRVHAVRGAAPLSVERPHGALAVDASALPLGAALSEDLHQCAGDYDAAGAGFDSAAAAVEFVERGRALVARLQGKLGDVWYVEYMPEPTRPPGLRLAASDAS